MIAHSTSGSLRACRRRIVPQIPRNPWRSSSRSFSFLKCLTNDGRSSNLSSRLALSTRPLDLQNWIWQKHSSYRHRTTRTQPYSSTAASQTQHTTIKDDAHPSLYYHLFEDEDLLNPVFALSFLEEKPASARSRAVLGWLPALAPMEAEAEGEDEGGENGLNDFRQNDDFLPILHKTIKESLLEDEIWTNSAIQTQSGWMHIYDQRNIPPLGRIPYPDDILASVRVEDGRMLIETYEPMPSYRLCTADGVCQLTDTLLDRLKAALREIVRKEEEEEGQNW